MPALGQAKAFEKHPLEDQDEVGEGVDLGQQLLAVQGDGLHPGVQQCFALGVGGQHMVVRERRLDPLLGQKCRIACQ